MIENKLNVHINSKILRNFTLVKFENSVVESVSKYKIKKCGVCNIFMKGKSHLYKTSMNLFQNKEKLNM